MTKDEFILLLLLIMGLVLAGELAYVMLRRKRRKKEMFRRKAEPVETLADKAHNIILTTESISRTLANQGISTLEADGILRQAKREVSMKDYASAIERAEAAKLALLRAKRQKDEQAPIRPAVEFDTLEPDDDDVPLTKPAARVEKDLDSLPTNYVQAKFMLGSAKDQLEKSGVKSGEAYSLYQKAQAKFDEGDYSAALSMAIKADRLVGSTTVELIAEEKPECPEEEEELVEYVCPGCENPVGEDDAFCRECGQNLESGCPGCGESIDMNDKFCRKCGYRLKQ